MVDHTTDLRSTFIFVRHRWRILGAAAVLGLIVGILYATRVPVPLSSTALVLLPQGNGSPGDDASEVSTQERLVVSTPVLSRAGRATTPALSAEQVKQRVAVEADTTRLIQIEAFSIRGAQAQALAQAVAQAYVDTMQDTARTVSGALVSSLRSRAEGLRQQQDAVDKQIQAVHARQRSARTAAGSRDAQLLTQLTVDQSDISLKLDKVEGDLALGTVPGTDIPTIVQPAAPATDAALAPRVAASALVGALVCGAGGAAVLLIFRRRDPRLRDRDELADAVGSTVLADVRSRQQRSVAEWWTLIETYQASAVDAWAFRQVLRALAASQAVDTPARTGIRPVPRVEHPRSLTLVALSRDKGGIALAPQLAAFAASVGVTTRLVVATAVHEHVASLWTACSAPRATELRPGLVVDVVTPARGRGVDGSSSGRGQEEAFEDVLAGPAGKGQGAVSPTAGEGAHSARALPRNHTPRHPRVDLTIVLAVADVQEPSLEGLPSTAVTALAVSPGVGSREEFARLAVAVDETGGRIAGIVVADPDPSDGTTGRRTLEERTRQTPLPVRLTGEQVALPAEKRGAGA